MKLAGETIHELRAHQIEIEKQNEKLRGRYFEIYDLAPVGYLTLNEQGSILEANHCAAALLGLPAGDLIGRTLSVFLAVEDRDALFPAKKHLPEDCLNVRSHAQELRLQKHDGTLTWVRLDMSAAVEIEAGKTVFLVTLTDISPSKKLEDELRHSEEKFKAMFNDSRDGLLVADVENKKIVLHNKVICDLLGYSDVEMASLYATDIHPAGTLSSVMDGFERQSRGELKIIENLPMRRKDGSVFFAEVNTSPISVGGRKCLMGSFRDITERKRLLEEKAEMEQRYFQAQKMESIGRLAGGVAHDFNNKLTSILCNIEIAMMEIPKHDPLQELLLDVKNSAECSASLTQQLLAFGRKQVAIPKRVDVNRAVFKAQELIERTIGENILVRSVPGKGVGMVEIDPWQLEQVLVNLSTNARDAMPKGGTLTIETLKLVMNRNSCARYEGLSPGEHVAIRVSDTGVGMTRGVMALVFEPFFTTKKLGKGTGLGLSSAFGIIRQNNGSIGVESAPGIGTTFTVVLPWAGEVDPAAENPAEPQKWRFPRVKARVMLVEDERIVLQTADRTLKRLGCDVRPFECGEDALKAFTENTGCTDLLVTDVLMPGMNGRDLADSMLALRPDLKVLFTSGYMEDTITEQGVMKGEVHFLAKPYSPKALAEKIAEILIAGPK